MTQEEKDLLIKDLSARLPYGVKLRYVEDLVVKKESHTITLNNIYLEHIINGDADIKPYLRPMSSMTEEEKNELRGLLWFGYPSDDYDNYSHRGIEIKSCLYDNEDKSKYDFEDFELLEHFLLKHHLDFRGLIPMGLALEAKEEMYEHNKGKTEG